jgi:UDP-glucose:(heptosyl)LPS alpha-1,3-glucosyltransferase
MVTKVTTPGRRGDRSTGRPDQTRTTGSDPDDQTLGAQLKIALVILHANPARGGAERYTDDLAHALRERKHEVSLLASTFPQGRPGPDDVLIPTEGVTRAGKYRSFLKSLDSHLNQTHYDIVHAMLPVRRCDIYHPHAGIAAEAVQSGHLKHDGTLQRTLARFGNRLNQRRQMFAEVEKQLLNSDFAPVVLCLSDYVKGFVRKHYTLPETKLATLFNATDLKRFDPSARPEARIEIRKRFSIQDEQVVGLMIAQDFARKGLHEAIASVAKVSDPRLVLMVVGKQDPSPYRRHAGQLGVSERVIFAGPTTDPYAFYGAADFFVLPTRHDPCSLVVLEALAMGVPVISTVFNGACEIMTSGTHGFVLQDPSDVQSLAQAMQQMLDPKRRSSMSTECLKLRPALAYEHHLDELERIYTRCKGVGVSASDNC